MSDGKASFWAALRFIGRAARVFPLETGLAPSFIIKVSMLAVPILLFAAAGAQTIRVDQYALRSGCGQSEQAIAKLPAGTIVNIKFALAGEANPCYLVSATLEGKTLQGYVSADALSDTDTFEQARRSAAPVMITMPPPASKTPAASSRREPPPLQFSVPSTVHTDVQKAMDLIRLNQPEQATQIMERLIKRYPKNAGLLAVAGMAAYRNDRLADAIWYWRESLDLRPDPELEQMYIDARREASIDRSAERKVGMRFVLRYDGTVASSDTATLMVSILEQEFTRISSELGCRADERIVTIVQSREAYFKTTRVAEWSAAAYDGKIRVPLVDNNQISPDIRQTFAHEIVHACLANLGTWPTWLHEGLAQRLSGRTLTPSMKQSLRTLAEQGKLPKLSELGQSWTNLNALEATLAYHLALAAAEVLYERHTIFGVRNLLKAPEQLPRITAELDKVLQAKD
jgi:hypothetical protein